MAAVATLAIAGCGSDKKSTSTTAGAATTAAAGAATTAAAGAATTAAATGSTGAPASGAGITIKDFKFDIPSGLTAGATVTITNSDGPTHTFSDKGGKFDVRVSGSGGQGTLTVPAAGTYSVICKIHSSMSGTLTVA
jgi:plastocyanin